MKYNNAMYLKVLLLLLISLSFVQAEITLDQKIGQMIMVGFRGTDVQDNDWISVQIKKGEIGGVILNDFDTLSLEYGRNIVSPEQLTKLTRNLQNLSKIPLFIAIDQEGGLVNRLKPEYGFPFTLSQEVLGNLNDLKRTFQHGKDIARTLASYGFNLNFAPVVDLKFDHCFITKKQRCFSEDPKQVALHAEAFITAHKEIGVLTCLKHFPGHGSASGDSHEGFVDVTSLWTEMELCPFQKLISMKNVDTVMTAHIFIRTLDDSFPASLSEKIMTGILRNKLHFDGLIITDDLQMKAISDKFSLKETVQHAILAGNDILLFANQIDYQPEIAPQIIKIVKELIKEGKIPINRIEESFRRIMKLKEQKK